MSTLKSYQISRLEAQILAHQRQYMRLRQLIELGDMQAVEQLSDLRKNIVTQQTKISAFQQQFANTEIEVFLYSLSTTLNSLLHSHPTMCTINEQRTAVPWKRQAQHHPHKFNCSKKTSTTQAFDTNRSKSHNSSRSRLLKSASEINVSARDNNRAIDAEKQRKKSVKRQQKKVVSEQTIQKSAETNKDIRRLKQNKEPNHRIIKGGKNKQLLPENGKISNLESMVTIRIGPEEFEQIIKLKNSMLTDFSFSS